MLGSMPSEGDSDSPSIVLSLERRVVPEHIAPAFQVGGPACNSNLSECLRVNREVGGEQRAVRLPPDRGQHSCFYTPGAFVPADQVLLVHVTFVCLQ